MSDVWKLEKLENQQVRQCSRPRRTASVVVLHLSAVVTFSKAAATSGGGRTARGRTGNRGRAWAYPSSIVTEIRASSPQPEDPANLLRTHPAPPAHGISTTNQA